MYINEKEEIKKLLNELNSINRDSLHPITLKEHLLLNKIVEKLFTIENPPQDHSQKNTARPTTKIPEKHIPIKKFL
jgi:hypothetical protein